MRLTRARKDEMDDFAAALSSNRAPDQAEPEPPAPPDFPVPPSGDEGCGLLSDDDVALIAVRLAAHVAAQREAAGAAAALPMRFGPTTMAPEPAPPFDLPGPDDSLLPSYAPSAAQQDDGPRHIGRPLGELLLGRGLVSEDQLRDALSTQTGSGKRLATSSSSSDCSTNARSSRSSRNNSTWRSAISIGSSSIAMS